MLNVLFGKSTKLRIALFPDDYLPDSTLVHAKMFHELALELKRLGHEPIIITPSHGKQSFRLKIDFIDGVEVWRFRNPPMRGQGNIQRVISESLISINAYLAIRDIVNKRKIDACINYSPTIFFGGLMKWFKRRYNTFVYLILRDLFPQWVIDEGLISSYSPIALYFRFFEQLNYKVSDCIGLMSQANINYFSKLNPHIKKIQVLRNWADTTPLYCDDVSINIRERFNLEDKVIFFYGGNIGHAQDMRNLLRLVSSMKVYPKAHFLFVGQGDEVNLVLETKKTEGLSNLLFLPSVSQKQYKELLTQVDIGLFSLSKKHKAHNFPGKLLGYMVQSLPILGSINEGNDLIDFINGKEAGFAFVNGEDELLKNGAISLLDDASLRKKIGAKGYQVLTENFSVHSAAQQILSTIEASLK